MNNRRSGYFEYFFFTVFSGFELLELDICELRVLGRPFVKMRVSGLGAAVDCFPTVRTIIEMKQEVQSFVLLKLFIQEAAYRLSIT